MVCSKDGPWTAIKILLGTISIPLKFNLYMEVMISVQDGAAGSTDRLSLNLTRSIKIPDISTGPLTRPFPCSLVRSFARSLTLLTPSLVGQ